MSKLRSKLGKVFAGLGVAILALIVFLAYLQASGNYHNVAQNELFRSAQPDYGLLETFALRDGGRTVLNLRGEHEGSDWYDTEIAASDALGLDHIDFAMSATRYMTPDEAQSLLAVMQDAPKPLLIHCKSGADRTGFASMIYLMALANVEEEIAERQLSIRFGHVGVPYLSEAYPMDESWEAFESSIGITDS